MGGGGGQEFFGVVKGGASFFQWVKGGGPKLFEGHRGGTRIVSQDRARIFLHRPRAGPEFFCACACDFETFAGFCSVLHVNYGKQDYSTQIRLLVQFHLNCRKTHSVWIIRLDN